MSDFPDRCIAGYVPFIHECKLYPRLRAALAEAERKLAEHQAVYQYNDADIDFLNEKIAAAERERDEVRRLATAVDLQRQEFYWRAERAEVDLATVSEQLHYANGTCELAMKHRDSAEAELAAAREALAAVQKDLAPIHICDVVSGKCAICTAVLRIDAFLERTATAAPTPEEAKTTPMTSTPECISEWRPIDTAPRASHVDIVLWHRRANIGSWMQDWDMGGTRGAWVINGGYVVCPTHWMPLPEPPK